MKSPTYTIGTRVLISYGAHWNKTGKVALTSWDDADEEIVHITLDKQGPAGAVKVLVPVEHVWHLEHGVRP